MQVTVTFGESHLSVLITEPGAEDYKLEVELFGKVGSLLAHCPCCIRIRFTISHKEGAAVN